uniref:Uncharacterized protein n=1 Tax=Rhizophora mucronata TaxID=61149 RepID=A0A2P2PH00_RHIMU
MCRRMLATPVGPALMVLGRGDLEFC